MTSFLLMSNKDKVIPALLMQGSQNLHLLAILLPKRAKLEMWQPHGRCVMEATVSRHSVLLNQLPKFGSSMSLDAPCLLDCDTGAINDINTLVNSNVSMIM